MLAGIIPALFLFRVWKVSSYPKQLQKSSCGPSVGLRPWWKSDPYNGSRVSEWRNKSCYRRDMCDSSDSSDNSYNSDSSDSSASDEK